MMKVAAVAVTYTRKELLSERLTASLSLTSPPDEIINITASTKNRGGFPAWRFYCAIQNRTHMYKIHAKVMVAFYFWTLVRTLMVPAGILVTADSKLARPKLSL